MNTGVHLYLIPTILAEGTENQVLSPVIREVVADLDIFFVENIRTARRFISSLKTGKVIDEIHFILLNKDTPESDTRAQVQALTKSAGIISEAGCPGIADPGAVAVAHAHDAGIRVVPLTGPSSILLALMGSGMSGQSFVFHGYLPIDKNERKKAIQALERSAWRGQSQIFMETPFRNDQLFQTLMETCQAETRLCVACNVTGSDEMIRTLPIKQWKQQTPKLHKLPTIFILGS